MKRDACVACHQQTKPAKPKSTFSNDDHYGENGGCCTETAATTHIEAPAVFFHLTTPSPRHSVLCPLQPDEWCSIDTPAALEFIACIKTASKLWGGCGKGSEIHSWGHVRGARRAKNFCFCQEQISVDWACLEMEEKVYLKCSTMQQVDTHRRPKGNHSPKHPEPKSKDSI